MSKIAKIEYISPKEISFAEYNPRSIKDPALERLKKSLNSENGKALFERRPILVNKRDGKLIVYAGNQRLKAARALGIETIPVIIDEISIEEEKERNIKDNLSVGEWDSDLLENNFDLKELEEWGLDLSEVKLQIEPEEEKDEVPEPPKEARAKLGQVYKLGRHRLMCGDSTMIDDVEKLMDGQKADMVFTDPPYGIGFEYNSHKDMEGEEYLQFCEEWFNSIQTLQSPYVVITTGWKYQKFWWNKDPKDCLYWICRDKRTGGGAFHFRKIEPIFIWGKPFAKYDFDFFEQLTQKENELKGKHSCPKPVSLIKSIVEKGCNYDSRVVDLFLGSGTTLIACEQTKRVCFGMELDPRYCDVIIERYCNLTGDDEEAIFQRAEATAE